MNQTQLAPRDFSFLENVKAQKKFESLNSGRDFVQEIGFAKQALSKNSYLATATKDSLVWAIYNLALTGLSLNPVLKLAYLVPRSRKVEGRWIVEAILEPSYKGLIKTLTDAGSVKKISSRVIYEHDEHEVVYGTNEYIIHKPLLRGERGNFIGVYSVATLKNGEVDFEWMRFDDVEEIRLRSDAVKSGKSSPWDTDYVEMAKKSVIRRHTKTLPLTDREMNVIDNLDKCTNVEFSDYRDAEKAEEENYTSAIMGIQAEKGVIPEKLSEPVGEVCQSPEITEKPKRKRRTKAEMEAARKAEQEAKQESPADTSEPVTAPNPQALFNTGQKQAEPVPAQQVNPEQSQQAEIGDLANDQLFAHMNLNKS